MSRREIARACYRSLLRWAKAVDCIPFSVKKDHLKLVSPTMAEAKVTIQDATTFRNVVRWSFRTNTALNEPEAREALSCAFLALRILNTTYSKQIAGTKMKRRENASVTGIDFSVGQVVRHKRDGYRGVIYGWDRVCQHPQYITNMNVNLVQPFYSIIPDENDAIRSFGGPRMLQYVAQQDLQSLDEPFKIINRNVLLHFESYSPKLGRYIPKKHLRYEYPGEYLEDEVQPCEGPETSQELDDPKVALPKPCRKKRPMKKSGKRSNPWQNRCATDTKSAKKNKRPAVEGSDKVI